MSKAQPSKTADVAVHLLLDESGSMLAHRPQTLQAFNALLDNLTMALCPITISLTVFGNRIQTVIDNVPNYEMPQLKKEDFKPNGGTPISSAAKIGLDSLKATGATRQILVIMTDGSIGHFSHKQRVQNFERDGGLVLLLAADQERPARVADLIGVQRAHSLEYTMANIETAMMKAAVAVHTFAGGGEVKAFA